MSQIPDSEKERLLIRYLELDDEIRTFLQKLAGDTSSLTSLSEQLASIYTDEKSGQDVIADCSTLIAQHPTFESMQNIQDTLLAMLFNWREMLHIRNTVNGKDEVH